MFINVPSVYNYSTFQKFGVNKTSGEIDNSRQKQKMHCFSTRGVFIVIHQYFQSIMVRAFFRLQMIKNQI